MTESLPHPPQKKPRGPRGGRGPRVRLTHFEIRRGEKLCLRIAVADDTFNEVGDELGALIKKIAPSTRTAVVEAAQVEALQADAIVISPQHDGNDCSTASAGYHERAREHLTAMFNSMCDQTLSDALEIAREVRARRAEGGN